MLRIAGQALINNYPLVVAIEKVSPFFQDIAIPFLVPQRTAQLEFLLCS